MFVVREKRQNKGGIREKAWVRSRGEEQLTVLVAQTPLLTVSWIKSREVV